MAKFAKRGERPRKPKDAVSGCTGDAADAEMGSKTIRKVEGRRQRMVTFGFTKIKFYEVAGYRHGKELHQGLNRPGCLAWVLCLHLL
jgi:hypothetical protein